MDKVLGRGVNKCLLQGTGEHSAPTWQLAELDPGFRGLSAQEIFSLLINKKDDLTIHSAEIHISP